MKATQELNRRRFPLFGATMCNANTASDLKAIAFPTELGWVGITYAKEVIHRLWFGATTSAELMEWTELESPFRETSFSRFEQQTARRLARFAAGQRESFSDLQINVANCTPFQRAVVTECRKIPYGRTASYQEVAIAVGSPKAARAVGMTMKRNPVPLIVPCHRVVGSRPESGGYSAGGGMATKQHLLQLEQSCEAADTADPRA